MDDTDKEFVNGCGSFFTCLQNYCTNVREILHKLGFCCWIEQIKHNFWFRKNESRSFAWVMVVLRWKFCWSWKLCTELYFFDSNFEVLTNTRSFSDVFVDCVVLGWLKPTKLCRMVKIMLQIVITLCLDDIDVKFVRGCMSTYTRFQSYCTNDREILHQCGILLQNWTNKEQNF